MYCLTCRENIIFKSFSFPHKCPPRYSCAVRIMSQPIFSAKAVIFHQALTSIPVLPSSNNKSRALSQLLSPGFLPARLHPREQSFSRATRRISLQPRLCRAGTSAYTCISARSQNRGEHKYSRQVSPGIITSVSMCT